MITDHIICFQTVEIVDIGKTLPEHNQMNLRFFQFEKVFLIMYRALSITFTFTGKTGNSEKNVPIPADEA